MQTLIITRVMLSLLLVPIGLIFGAVVFVLLTFIALSISPFLALATLIAGAGLIVGVAKWESARIARENPPDDT